MHARSQEHRQAADGDICRATSDGVFCKAEADPTIREKQMSVLARAREAEYRKASDGDSATRKKQMNVFTHARNQEGREASDASLLSPPRALSPCPHSSLQPPSCVFARARFEEHRTASDTDDIWRAVSDGGLTYARNQEH